MTLYRHFSSKDELVAECLRRVGAKADALWDRIAADHPNDAPAQLKAWVAAMGAHLADLNERGCAMCNAAVELPDRTHRSEEHTSELQSHSFISYAVFCLK